MGSLSEEYIRHENIRAAMAGCMSTFFKSSYTSNRIPGVDINMGGLFDHRFQVCKEYFHGQHNEEHKKLLETMFIELNKKIMQQFYIII